MEVISMLLLAHLASLSNSQQAQLVYDKHYVEPPQLPHSQPHYPNQNFAPHSAPQPHGAWPHPTQTQPNIAMFAPGNVPSQAQYHQHPHQNTQGQLQHYSQPQQPHSHAAPHPGLPPGAVAIPVSSAFASRRGPIDKMIQGAKQYFPGSGKKRSRGKPGTPIRFMEMNRLPKPPKYPLYDMPDLGMATPPPPPLLHPMAASSTNMFESYAHPQQPPQRGGRAPPRGKKPPHRRRGQSAHHNRRPGRPGNSRQGPPPPQQSQRPHRRPPLHGKPKHVKHQKNYHGHGPGQGQHGFDQGTSESNLDSQPANSPPLGRPLNYDEYMQRPSHSFTDDPWNFDPFAANYNSGMNTFAMKYNYDPLGMNSLDKTQSHLDPEQLSYPGDTHTLQDAPAGVGKVTQLGGWDKSPDSYRLNNLSPPPVKDSPHGHGHLAGLRRNQTPQKQYQNQQSANSFNQFYDQADSASVVQSDSLNVNPLKILSEANPGIEFTIESSSNGDGVGDTYKGGSTNYDYPEWKNYPQQPHDVYGGTGGDSDGQYSHNVNNYAKTAESQNYLKQLQESSKFENGNYDASTQLHTFALSQDYLPRERPLSDLSDSFNPHSGGSDMTVDLTPPSETAAMFKRQGSRPSRQEKTPMIELEGLSLFKDLLKNEKASSTRSQLIQVLTN